MIIVRKLFSSKAGTVDEDKSSDEKKKWVNIIGSDTALKSGLISGTGLSLVGLGMKSTHNRILKAPDKSPKTGTPKPSAEHINRIGKASRYLIPIGAGIAVVSGAGIAAKKLKNKKKNRDNKA